MTYIEKRRKLMKELSFLRSEHFAGGCDRPEEACDLCGLVDRILQSEIKTFGADTDPAADLRRVSRESEV